jgi:hypothetical protein
MDDMVSAVLAEDHDFGQSMTTHEVDTRHAPRHRRDETDVGLLAVVGHRRALRDQITVFDQYRNAGCGARLGSQTGLLGCDVLDILRLIKRGIRRNHEAGSKTKLRHASFLAQGCDALFDLPQTAKRCYMLG